MNIEIVIICSPNQPATNIGQEFHELGVTVGAGVGGEVTALHPTHDSRYVTLRNATYRQITLLPLVF